MGSDLAWECDWTCRPNGRGLINGSPIDNYIKNTLSLRSNGVFLIFNGFRDIDVAKHTSWPPPTWPQKLKKPYFSKYTMDFNETFWRGWAFAKEDLVISIWFLIFFFFFFFTIFPFFINIQKKIWGQTLGALWLLYYINIYPVLSVYEKIPMGPPIFHEIWRSEFGGHLGSWQKGHYFNKKNSEIFHPI